jgi:hypothetical protein
MEVEYMREYDKMNKSDGPYRNHIHLTMGYAYLVEQYELIQKKACKLPAMQRAAIVKEYESSHYPKEDNK